jgi:hypothetical protein
MLTPKKWIDLETQKHHAGRVDIGLTAWLAPYEGIRSQVFSWADALATAALIIRGEQPALAACLAFNDVVTATPHGYQALLDTLEPPEPELLIDIIRTADGHLWQITRNIDVPVASAEDFPDLQSYSVSAARNGLTSTDDVRVRVGQLLTSVAYDKISGWTPYQGYVAEGR